MAGLTKEQIAAKKPTELPVKGLPEYLKDKQPTVKVAQFHVGIDLLGSKTSAQSKDSDIFELPNALLLRSKKNKRMVIIPFTNVRGYELL